MFILDVCGIPGEITGTLHTLYSILLIAIPIIIVVFGLIDFIKAITGKKDEEISNGAKLFLKRLVMGAIAFFVLAIVKLVVSLLANSSVGSANGVVDCLNGIFGS